MLHILIVLVMNRDLKNSNFFIENILTHLMNKLLFLGPTLHLHLFVALFHWHIIHFKSD